jgi:hypothetical protein
MTAPDLKYHQATFNLLNITPEIDDAAVLALDDLETRLEIKLPAALREWYSLKNARQHLRCNDDHVLPIEKLGYDDFASEDMLLFIRENQDTAMWALQMDGSDNPPVFVSNDDYDEWAMCAATFSDFVYGRVWEWRWMLGRSSLILWDDAAFSADGLAYLRQHFTEQPTGYNGFWRYAPDSTIYRFQRESKHVRLVTSPARDIACGLHSDDPALMLDVLKTLRPNVEYREQKRGNLITYYVGNLTDQRIDFESIPF